jgi:signal transduction histidine kinase
VDDLLDLSRLESGRWRPKLEPLDPLHVARAAWETLAAERGGKDVTFLDHSEGDARVLADRGALDQVFSNLFDNALRYSRAGGEIRVAVRPAPEASERAVPERVPQLVIEVSDTGAGIPRDALPRIFERFYRVDPARSRSEGGTGLGLSIVRHLMESMGGRVQAESTLGKGTTIRLWLPVAPSGEPGHPPVAEP